MWGWLQRAGGKEQDGEGRPSAGQEAVRERRCVWDYSGSGEDLPQEAATCQGGVSDSHQGDLIPEVNYYL